MYTFNVPIETINYIEVKITICIYIYVIIFPRELLGTTFE